MPFIPVPNVAMVELFYRQDDQSLENTLYFENENPWSITGLEQLCVEITSWWGTSYAPITTNQVSLVTVKATSLESDTAPAFERPTLIAGGLAQPAEPNSVTLAIKFLTGGRGRSSRGRNYIVGLHVDAVTNNEVNPVHAAQYLDAYLELLDVTVITNGVWVVVSRFTDNAPRVTGIAQPVTGVAFTDFIVDSQRRRLPGRGS